MNSIRRQLTRRLLATTLGLLAVGLAALLAVAGYAVVHQFDLALRTKALAISTVAVVTADAVRVDFTDRFLEGFDDRVPRDFFQLRLKDGPTLARSESLGDADLPRNLGRLDAPRYFLCTLPTGRPGRAIGFVFQPKQPKGTAHPIEAELVVASDREDLDETLFQLLGLAGGSAVLLAGATLRLVPRLLRRGLLPLDRLGEQAAQIDAGSLGVRFPLQELPEELQPIGRRLNALLARLEQSFERERRFSADLAHELRTPIAELRSLAECALKWPESRDAATDHDLLAIARHMESLTASMLALARGQTGQLPIQVEPVDLAELTATVWQPFAARAAARHLKLHKARVPAVVAADATLLRSILSNLFDNAVEYSPEFGTIELRLEADATTVVLLLANAAGDLETADVAQLFDPLWRKESARTGGRHFGLGLSLARTFAAAMYWTLDAALDENHRLILRLEGPRMSAPMPPPAQGVSSSDPALANK